VKFKEKLVSKQTELYSLHLHSDFPEAAKFEFAPVDVKAEEPDSDDSNNAEDEEDCLPEFPECDVRIRNNMHTSLETREKIIQEHLKGKKTTAISRQFGVKRTTCHEIIKKYKETGIIKSKTNAECRGRIKKKDKETIKSWIESDPDITIKTLVEKSTKELGVDISKSMMRRLSKRMGCVVKKDCAYGEKREKK
jgi:transposase